MFKRQPVSPSQIRSSAKQTRIILYNALVNKQSKWSREVRRRTVPRTLSLVSTPSTFTSVFMECMYHEQIGSSLLWEEGKEGFFLFPMIVFLDNHAGLQGCCFSLVGLFGSGGVFARKCYSYNNTGGDRDRDRERWGVYFLLQGCAATLFSFLFHSFLCFCVVCIHQYAQTDIPKGREE